MAQARSKTLKFWLRLLVGFSLAIGTAIAIHTFNLHLLVGHALLWVNCLGAIGIIAFIILYNLATILFIPGSLLTLGGGALYGVFWGSVYVFIAATLGATIAFLIGRYVARNWVKHRIKTDPVLQAIDTAVAQNGLKIVFLMRLSPLVPFNLLNYALGITRVSLSDYVLGSTGMIPGTIMYVYIGSLAGEIATLGMSQAMSPHAQATQWLLKIIGLFATIALTVYITRIAQRSLNQGAVP